MFDLNLLPLSFIANQEQTDLPGFHAVNAPRRAARGRLGDQFLILATLSLRANFAPNELQQLLAKSAQAYFDTPGSVTAGLRMAADRLNQALLNRNLHAPVTGQVIGAVNLAVVHGSSLMLAHGGPTHSYLLSGQAVEHFYDPQPVGKGLGQGRPMPLRFYQAELKHNDDLIFCAEPPDTWSEDNLAGGAALALDQLLRRLLIRRPDDFSCGVIQFQAGTGKITLVHVSPNPVGAVPVLVGAQPVRASEPAPAQASPAEVNSAGGGESEPGTDFDPSLSKPLLGIEPEATTVPQPAPAAAAPMPPKTPAVSAPPASIPQPAAPVRRRSDEIKRRKLAEPEPVQVADRRKRLLPWFARLWRGGRKIQEGSSRATGGFLSSLLPGPADRPGSLSRGSMAFIAIAIPLVVVAIATTVYDQRGRTQSYQQYLTAARLAAQQAQQQTDPAVVRSYWEQVLSDLQKAGPIQTGTDMLALQQQAEIAIDQLDGITRMEYQPAVVGGLSDGVRITQMIASGTDLYLLDAGHGQVLRATLSGRGYAVDTTFSCGAGAGSGTGGVIAMVPMPRGNEYKAAVMGLDSSGGIQYCIPGEAPLAATIPQPSPKWASVTAVTYDSDSLYVLDAKSNVLWVYNGSSGTFKDPPQPFFDSETPPMGDAVDLAVNNTDLYLLHADGHLTMCTLSLVATSPTRCTEPAQLSDPRPNHKSPLPVLPGTRFNRILFTQPPDPSIYLLDPQSGSIYHFSLRLNLQSQMKGGTNLTFSLPTTPATAFTISTNRTAFLAFNNQVYYALIP